MTTKRSLVASHSAAVAELRYHPPPNYDLDLEVFSTKVFYDRATREFMGTPARVRFHLLILAEKGRFTHRIDHKSFDCKPGTILNIRPGQVHLFDVHAPWHGTVIAFRPEFLHPAGSTMQNRDFQMARLLESLPPSIPLRRSDVQTIASTVRRLFLDTARDAPRDALHALLQTELRELLLRIHLSLSGKADDPASSTRRGHVARFEAYRRAVEKHFQHNHTVSAYAKLLGCSAKSVREAALEIAGVNAKAVISNRIVLEAKRLLVHTEMPVAVISGELGFGEATNFVKFFRKEEKLSPNKYRQLHRYGSP